MMEQEMALAKLMLGLVGTIKKKTKITIYYPFTFVSVSYALGERSSCSSELVESVSFAGELVSHVRYRRKTRQHSQISPETCQRSSNLARNSSASSDLAGELVSVVRSGQSRRIWSENSSPPETSQI
ncbi:hypothetical protein Rs2_05350 [Raphanus sativus]|nr:hypothetical protein Rs2_05350 [Raphanus sativus]